MKNLNNGRPYPYLLIHNKLIFFNVMFILTLLFMYTVKNFISHNTKSFSLFLANTLMQESATLSFPMYLFTLFLLIIPNMNSLSSLQSLSHSFSPQTHQSTSRRQILLLTSPCVPLFHSRITFSNIFM